MGIDKIASPVGDTVNEAGVGGAQSNKPSGWNGENDGGAACATLMHTVAVMKEPSNAAQRAPVRF